VNTLGPRILLVEDTPELSLWVGAALRQTGMQVEFAVDGVQALDRLKAGHRFDAVVLDLNIPGPDGLSVLQTLRSRSDPVPVLILTARANVADRVLGLNLGADDYLPKPFELSELEARLAALLRRQGRVKTEWLELGPLSLNTTTGETTWQGVPFSLTPRESTAVRVLLTSAHRTVSKDALHRAIFADDKAGLDAVEVLIHRLRKKLESQESPQLQIATFRGLGYMLTVAHRE
jgi:two-component system, OmpR family, response regulator TctD